MAYNPAMYNSYGQPQYQQPMQQMPQGMVWVDGEMEAKARQIPTGATQFAMWDINEPVIYIKSLNPMGIPNPIRKIRYQMDAVQETRQQNLLSGDEGKEDTAQYVKYEDLQSMKEEIMQAIKEINTAKKTPVKGDA